MPHGLSNRVWDRLACSYCGAGLKGSERGADCPNCGSSYPYTSSGSLDLRLKKPRQYRLDFDLGTALLPEAGFDFSPLQANEDPAVDFSNAVPPRHLTREILSYFPKAPSDSSLALDLGCGAGVHKNVCERAGFEWVGMDHDAPQAPILGDAHCLPFKDETFEFILCVTVLQYIRYPFVMMREAQRVLKPGGKLIGTVAFLEPSHGTSYYHHSHLGAYNSLHYGGFKALANMGLFHGMPTRMARALVLPLQFLHELWWRTGGLVRGRDVEATRIRHFTGSFTFVASK